MAKRFDDEENNNEPPKGHGNTRLPFGLCKKYGIEYGADWTPKDAWEALRGKGVSAADEYAKLGGGKTSYKTKSGDVWSNLSAEKSSSSLMPGYVLRGDFDHKTISGERRTASKQVVARFPTKEDMYIHLKEQGIGKFKDPDSGETVNPLKMELPKVVGRLGDEHFKGIKLGVRTDRYGHPLDGRGYTVYGVGMDGKKRLLKSLGSLKEMRKYLEKIECKESEAEMTRDLKKLLQPEVKSS